MAWPPWTFTQGSGPAAQFENVEKLTAMRENQITALHVASHRTPGHTPPLLPGKCRSEHFRLAMEVVGSQSHACWYARETNAAVVTIAIARSGFRPYPGAPGQNGANGKDGQSVTSTALSPGDPNCATGGSSFTSASGTTYACNGATGPAGPPGSTPMVSALIGTDGTVLFANASPGVTLTIGHPATGRYSLSASGLGAGSPLPSLTPEGTAAVIYYSGSTSGIGTLNTAVVMADGQDHDWSVTIIGIPLPAPGQCRPSNRFRCCTAGRTALSHRLGDGGRRSPLGRGLAGRAW